MLEEYRPDSDKNAAKNDADVEFCYYLFEMKHDAVCPPEKTKISPGSVFLIMYVLNFFAFVLDSCIWGCMIWSIGPRTVLRLAEKKNLKSKRSQRKSDTKKENVKIFSYML